MKAIIKRRAKSEAEVLDHATINLLRAGRIMLEEIKARARAGDSFAFETTLSGLMYARLIPQWRKQH